jgi:hypothetical protein
MWLVQRLVSGQPVRPSFWQRDKKLLEGDTNEEASEVSG